MDFFHFFFDGQDSQGSFTPIGNRRRLINDTMITYCMVAWCKCRDLMSHWTPDSLNSAGQAIFFRIPKDYSPPPTINNLAWAYNEFALMTRWWRIIMFMRCNVLITWILNSLNGSRERIRDSFRDFWASVCVGLLNPAKRTPFSQFLFLLTLDSLEIRSMGFAEIQDCSLQLTV